MPKFSVEIIKLINSNCESFKFIEFPHGEWFIVYISQNNKLIKFLEKSSKESNWTDKILQVNSNLPEIIGDCLKIIEISLFFDNKGDLILIYNKINLENQLQLFLTESYSYGKKWSPVRLISHELSSWKLHSSPIIINKGMKIGSIIMPVEDESVRRSLVVISEDNGKSWHISLYVEPEETNDNDDEELFYNSECGSYNPAIIEENNGLLRLFCWINEKKVLESYVSSDFGATWHKSKNFPSLPIDRKGNFDIIRLKNSGNALTEKILVFGSQKINKKYCMTAWISEDENLNFKIFWQDTNQYDFAPKYCQCYQDSTEQIHLLFNLNDGRIQHIWN